MNLLRTTARVIKGGGLATPAAPAPPPHSWPGNGTGYASPAHDVSDASLLLVSHDPRVLAALPAQRRLGGPP